MDKNKLDKLVQPVVDLYNEIETNMLVNIASKLQDADGLEKNAVSWKLQNMEKLGLLQNENIKTIKYSSGIASNEINDVLINAGLAGIKPNEKEMAKALKKGAQLLKPKPVYESNALVNILYSYQSQANNTLNLTNQTLIDQSQKTYISILDESVALAMTGEITGQKVVRRVISHWAEQGIPALIDRAGRKWSPEGYVRMVAMSTSNNVVNEMQDARFEDWGVDHTEISSHAGARPKCAPYQGRVFSLNPGDNEYPYIGSTSMGEPDGLFGINCGHYKYPYIPGFSERTYEPYDEEENKRIYKESQQQRYYERQIRNAKTRKKMLEAAGDNEGAGLAQKLISKRQATMRKFIKRTGRKRRYNREQIVTGKIPDSPGPDKLKSKVINTKQKIKDQNAKKKSKKKMKAQSEPEIKEEIKQKMPKQDILETAVEKEAIEETVEEAVEDKAYEPDPFSADTSGKSFEEVMAEQEAEQKEFEKLLKKAKPMFSHQYMSDKEMVEEYKQLMKDKELEEIKETAKEVAKAKALGNIEKPDESKYAIVGDDYFDIDRRKDAMTIEGFNEKEKEILYEYTDAGFEPMNEYLRSNGKESRDAIIGGKYKVSESVKALHNAIEKKGHKLSKGIIFKRQMKKDAIEKIFGDEVEQLMRNASTNNDSLNKLRSMLGNATFGDKGFISTTFNDTSFHGASTGIEINIFAPKGFSNGMFVDSISRFKNEGEYLLNSGTEFRIFDVNVSGGKLMLKVEPIVKEAEKFAS